MQISVCWERPRKLKRNVCWASVVPPHVYGLKLRCSAKKLQYGIAKERFVHAAAVTISTLLNIRAAHAPHSAQRNTSNNIEAPPPHAVRHDVPTATRLQMRPPGRDMQGPGRLERRTRRYNHPDVDRTWILKNISCFIRRSNILSIPGWLYPWWVRAAASPGEPRPWDSLVPSVAGRASRITRTEM